MFVLILTYKKPLEEVDRLMKSHVVWLKKHFDDGTFIACGRQIPRTGGVIIAGNKPKEKIEAIIEDDPFKSEGAADYQIIEFNASMHAKGFGLFL